MRDRSGSGANVHFPAEKCRAHPSTQGVHSFQISCQAGQPPFTTHRLQLTEMEAPKPHPLLDDHEDRFHHRLAPRIQRPAFRGLQPVSQARRRVRVLRTGQRRCTSLRMQLVERPEACGDLVCQRRWQRTHRLKRWRNPALVVAAINHFDRHHQMSLDIHRLDGRGSRRQQIVTRIPGTAESLNHRLCVEVAGSGSPLETAGTTAWGDSASGIPRPEYVLISG